MKIVFKFVELKEKNIILSYLQHYAFKWCLGAYKDRKAALYKVRTINSELNGASEASYWA